jgi:hypothetical protein
MEKNVNPPKTNYWKNYLDVMNQKYKTWYSDDKNKIKDDAYDSFFSELKKQDLTTENSPAWEVTNLKYPSEPPGIVVGKDLPKDIKDKVDKGRMSVKFIENYPIKDENAEYNSNLTRYLMSRNPGIVNKLQTMNKIKN